MESETTVTQPTAEGGTDYLKYVGGRKFTLAMFIISVTSILCWFSKIDSGVFSVVVVATLTAYTSGNVLQKLKT